MAALQGLTLSVRSGEICVLLGPSGSGKTTLLRVLAGLDRASAGTARVLGVDLGALSARRLTAYRSEVVGYAEQHYWRTLARELTARELVGVQLGLAGTPRSAREKRADELLERVGLLDRRDARPGELSGGEQQRVAVCAALAHRPRLLLADEPTGELDRANAAIVYSLIGDLAREHGCTTLIVSHDPSSTTIADRIVRVRDGRVSGETAVADGRDEAIVVGRGGWLRLPEEYLRRVGIRDRASARVDGVGIVVSPADGAAADAETIEVRPSERTHDSGEPVAAAVEDVTRTFSSGSGVVTALGGLTAAFERGTLYAVTGPSGSGKTTLLHLLAGLDLPTSGDVVVLGTSLPSLDRAARAAVRRDRIAFIGQEPGLVPFLSALENVELSLSLRGVAPDEAAERAREALGTVGLAERAAQPVSALSTGERGRAAIARAVAARPALLLADEPTARLDQANALAVGALFSRLVRELGTTVVCATHDPVVIEQADEELVLARARTPAAALSSA